LQILLHTNTGRKDWGHTSN